MLKDKYEDELLRNEISKRTAKKSFFRGATINLLDKWVKTEQDLPPYDKTTKIVRSMEMYIRYCSDDKKFIKSKPFYIYTYLVEDARIAVQDWADLVQKSKEQDDEGLALAWMLRNTNLSEELMWLAMLNEGCVVQLAFDVVKYIDKISGGKYLSEPTLATPEQIGINAEYIKLKRETWEEINRKRALDNYYKKKENRSK